MVVPTAMPIGEFEWRDGVRRVEFYDQHGFYTSLLFDGGWVIIYCKATRLACVDDNDQFELIDPNEQPIKKETCATIERDGFRLDINAQTAWGVYKCKRGDQPSIPVLIVGYRLCSSSDEMCNVCANDRGFCMFKPEESAGGGHQQHSCAFTQDDENVCGSHWDENDYFRTPSIYPTKAFSLCRAMSAGFDYSQAWSAYYDGAFIMEGSSDWYARITYANETPRLLGEPIEVKRHAKQVRISYANHRALPAGSNLTCWLRRAGGEVIEGAGLSAHNLEVPTTSVDVTLSDDLFEWASSVYGFKCQIDAYTEHNRGYQIAFKLWNTLVIMNGKAVAKRLDNGDLECSLEPANEMDDVFNVEYSWIEKTLGTEVPEQSAIRSPKPGQYVCRIKITYKSCAPYRRFMHTDERAIITVAGGGGGVPAGGTASSGGASGETTGAPTGDSGAMRQGGMVMVFWVLVIGWALGCM